MACAVYAQSRFKYADKKFKKEIKLMNDFMVASKPYCFHDVLTRMRLMMGLAGF